VNGYTYVAPPTITGVNPGQGPVAGGTSVLVQGSGFYLTPPCAVLVTFAGTPATAVVVVSDTELTCNTPAHPEGKVDVAVTTPGGSAVLSQGFEYLPGLPPQFTTLPSANPNPGVVNREIAFTCGVGGGVPPLTVEWTFGDGSPPGTGESVVHVYRKPGIYHVHVKVTDSYMQSAETDMTPDMMVRSVFGEFDVDSFFDIVWWHSGTGDTKVWLMNGTTLVEERLMGMENPALYSVVGTSDVNRDGKPDLLLWYASGGGVYVRIMDGTTPGALYRIGGCNAAMWTVVGGMDLDGDGTGDILFRRSDGVVWAWRLNPGTPPTVAAIVRIGSASVANWICATGVGDINGDGQCDVLWERIAPKSAYIWVMAPGGTGVATQGTIAPETGGWSLRGAGDYDGDGLEDLLWHDQAAARNKLWKMNGLIKVGDIALPPDGPGLMVGPK
jgi:PKD repeat protein